MGNESYAGQGHAFVPVMIQLAGVIVPMLLMPVVNAGAIMMTKTIVLFRIKN
jgi:hypothetical protein